MKTKLLLAILASFLLTAFPAVAQMITGTVSPSASKTIASQVEAVAQEKGVAKLADSAVHPSGIKRLPKTNFAFKAEITRKGVIIHELWPVATVAEMEACIIARDLKATVENTEVKTMPEAQATGEVKPPRAEIVFGDEPVATVTTTPATMPVPERSSYTEIVNLPTPEVKKLPVKKDASLIEMVDAFEKEFTQPAPVPTPAVNPVEAKPAAPAVISINSAQPPVAFEQSKKVFPADPLYTYGQEDKLELLEKRLPPFNYPIDSTQGEGEDMWQFFANSQNWKHGIKKRIYTAAPSNVENGIWMENIRVFAMNLLGSLAITLGILGLILAVKDLYRRFNPIKVKTPKGMLPTIGSKLTRLGPEDIASSPATYVSVAFQDDHIVVKKLPTIYHGDTSRIPRSDLDKDKEEKGESPPRGKFPFHRTGVLNFQPRKAHQHQLAY